MNILYLISEYPAISHTFILHEISALRKNQYRFNMYEHSNEKKFFFTASIHRPKNIDTMGYDEKKEYTNTYYIFEKLLFKGCISLCKLTIYSPKNFLKLVYNAFRWCINSGPKSLPKAIAYILEACLLNDFCKANNIKHVHVHFANAASTVAMLLSSMGSVSFSISAHGPDIFYNCNENLLAIKGSNATFIRCISHYCSSQFMRILQPLDWNKIHVVRCGVDIINYTSTMKLKNKNRCNDDGDRSIKLVCIGRLCPAKAQVILLQSFLDLYESLDAQGIRVELTIVGGFSGKSSILNDNIHTYIFCGDNEYLLNKKLSNDLRSEIQPYRDIIKQSSIDTISSIVHFTGPVSHEEALNECSKADIFVLPSFAEGVPIVLMEAMSMGIPCISTRIAGIGELIEHNENGLLCHAGDSKSLTECMHRLVIDSNLRNKLGKAGQKTIFSTYNLFKNSKTLNALFDTYI